MKVRSVASACLDTLVENKPFREQQQQGSGGEGWPEVVFGPAGQRQMDGGDLRCAGMRQRRRVLRGQ